MNIDLVLHGHYLQRIQEYPFVHAHCLFDFLTFLFHYSWTSLQLQTQCMTHFAQSLQQPINPQIQELIDIHFNVFLLYEDHDINFFTNLYSKNEHIWGENCAYFVWKIIHVWSKNNCVIFFWTNDDYISNNTLQLLYHDDMVNAKNGHYEPITFYNASWKVAQNMLPQTKHTNQPTKMSIKQWGKKQSLSFYGVDDNMHS